jgi:hypothetical protein
MQVNYSLGALAFLSIGLCLCPFGREQPKFTALQQGFARLLGFWLRHFGFILRGNTGVRFRKFLRQHKWVTIAIHLALQAVWAWIILVACFCFIPHRLEQLLRDLLTTTIPRATPLNTNVVMGVPITTTTLY